MNATSHARKGKSFITALLPLIAVPMLTQASFAHADADAAMDACIQAFVASNLQKEQPVTVRKIESIDSPVAPRAKESTIYISARGRHSGKQVAKATCVADSKGVVLTMNVKPATATLAQTQASLDSSR
jgi:hypothetical protein